MLWVYLILLLVRSLRTVYVTILSCEHNCLHVFFFRHDLHHFSFVVFHLWAHERGFPSKSGGSRSDTIDIDGPGVLKKNVTPSS